MKITQDNIKPITGAYQNNFKGQNVQSPSISYEENELPSLYPIGQSLIGTELPVSYMKIGEITIPGLKEKAQIYKLANGQRVIIAPKKGPALIKTTYNVGSMNEPDNIRGMSHFIEHNLFNGSKNLAPKEYDLKVSELGGDTNASTSFAYTDYYLQLQLLNDNSLEEAIKLNAEQTQFPIFPNEQLIKEKEPVKSEIDMCNDDANTVAVCKVLKNLFNIKTSSEDFVIGTKSNINSFNREMVLDYFNTWYTPDNAVTVITGDVSPEETINIAAKYFNKQNDYSNVHKRTYEPLYYSNKPIREDIVKSNTTQPSATLGFAIPEGTSESELDKLAVLFDILNSTDSGLYKQLNQIGASFEITTENMQNKPQGAKAALITAYASEDKLEEAIKIIYNEITNISNNPPLSDEVFNVKKNMTNRILNTSESSQALNEVLTDAALNYNYDSINSSINNIQKITPYDITATARKYLDLNKVSMCVSHHRDITNEAIISNYKNSEAKQVSFGAKISPIDNIREENSKVSKTTLPNNIESTVIKGNPYAKSSILLDFNTDELNDAPAPLLDVLNKLMQRGSSLRGALDFNSILNSKNISMSFSVDNNGLFVIAECNGENIQDTMSLINESIKYPNFTNEEFLRAKQFVKEDILSEKISAYDNLLKEIHPDLKKYDSKEARLKELEKINIEDINAIYSKLLQTSQVQAVMSAPVDVSPDLANIFNTNLANGYSTFKPFSITKGSNYNIYKPNTEQKIITKPREQAQAEILQAYKFKESKNVEDIAKIELLNMILGSGGMSSRLFLDLREDKKLAYSVGSKLSKEKDTGVLTLKIGTTTQNPDPKEGSSENVTKALDGFKRNVELLKTQNVTEKELKNAKTIYKTRILDNFETNMSKTIIYTSANYSYYGKEYYEKLFEAIDKITADDIRAAANYVFKNPPVISIAASQKTLDEINVN